MMCLVGSTALRCFPSLVTPSLSQPTAMLLMACLIIAGEERKKWILGQHPICLGSWVLTSYSLFPPWEKSQAEVVSLDTELCCCERRDDVDKVNLFFLSSSMCLFSDFFFFPHQCAGTSLLSSQTPTKVHLSVGGSQSQCSMREWQQKTHIPPSCWWHFSIKTTFLINI